MTMPGFTAETSLYTTSEVYELSAVGFVSAGRQEIVPQAPPGPWPDWKIKCTYGPCYPIFNCVDPLGCEVVGYTRQRCCYLYGISLGCKWVSC
jgi:hypothetical protein